MSSLGDRLRAITGASGATRPGAAGATGSSGAVGAAGGAGRGASRSGLSAPGAATEAARALGGDICERNGCTFVLVDRAYPPDRVHGRLRIADAAAFASSRCEYFPLIAGTASRDDDGQTRTLCLSNDRLLYLDLETTGLAGGAGTYAFLVGCAWFEGEAFRVRQYLLTGFGGEPVMLDAVADEVRGAGALVTYNGKTFDVPVLDMRYQFHRRRSPLAELAHLDMLHTARRLWRGADDEAAGTTTSCSLGVLEGLLCGVQRLDDVPGFEIPSRYFGFVRTGDAAPLASVLEHNRLDLLSLAMITARALRLVRAGADGAETARECLGLGRMLERAGRFALARACFARAAGLVPLAPLTENDGSARAEALRAYAVLCRRAREYVEAAAAWERIVALRRCPPHIRREASEALAVHYEHRTRNLDAARRFALDALLPGIAAAREEAVRYRLARLDRKIAAGSPTVLHRPSMLDD